MANPAEMFEAAADGPIIAAVVGDDERLPWGGDRKKHSLHGMLVSWEEARRVLDYEYDKGFGGADCHAAYAWTENRVLFVHEYDGATGICSVPRNPSPCEPAFGGNDAALLALEKALEARRHASQKPT